MKHFLALLLSLLLFSCQFSETMVINEDGSGQMTIQMDMSEMMAMIPANDTTVKAVDSVLSFKDMFEEKKDSIAKLPKTEQERLKLLENYKMRMVIDPEESKMTYDIFTDFKSVEEANNLMEGLNTSESMNLSIMDGKSQVKNEKEIQPQPTGVKFKYANNKFSRDAYIIDEEAFSKMKDSIKSAEPFLEKSMYSIKYTFPKKIKSVSAKDANISADGKTVTFERPFLNYLKNPDELDVEIILEEN